MHIFPSTSRNCTRQDYFDLVQPNLSTSKLDNFAVGRSSAQGVRCLCSLQIYSTSVCLQLLCNRRWACRTWALVRGLLQNLLLQLPTIHQTDPQSQLANQLPAPTEPMSVWHAPAHALQRWLRWGHMYVRVLRGYLPSLDSLPLL